MFLHQTGPAPGATFAPAFDDAETAETNLWSATRDRQIYVENANAEDAAMAEAYARRNRAIFEATGVQLKNPRRDFDMATLQEANRALDSGGDPDAVFRRLETRWQADAARLARERPELSRIIAADRPISDDALAITRGAAQADADAGAAAETLPFVRRAGIGLGAAFAGMARDPLQVATLFLGGGFSSAARTVGGRILQGVLTEAAINGGVETAVQAASLDWKRAAGLDPTFAESLGQVGLAALFGGGFGGLVEGGRAVFKALGRAAPDDVLARVAAGAPEPGDTARIAEALGTTPDPATLRAATLAAEQPALDRAAFGPPPAGMSADAADALAARTLRGAESDSVARALDIAAPLAKRPPRQATTLTEFLRAQGGVIDEAGALRTMGLDRTLAPQAERGRTLDMAREAAAEAGFFDDAFGDPQTAVARSTPDDLLRALEAETRGETLTSPRLDGDAAAARAAWEQAAEQREATRRLLEEIDGASETLGLDRAPSPAILLRAAALVDDETDAATALERALEEDYRDFADRPDTDAPADALPFFAESPIVVSRPEPGTPEAQENAALALTEAGARIDVEGSEDPWERFPDGTDAEGKPVFASHAERIAAAERAELHADLIASCRD